MPRIGKEDVQKRENLLREAIQKNPKLKMEEAQSLLLAAGGPRMRPQRFYDIRKEVKEALAKGSAAATPATGDTTPSANRLGGKTAPAKKAAKTTSTKKAAPAKKAAKTTSTKKAAPAKKATAKTTPAKKSTAKKTATTIATPGPLVANRAGEAAPATGNDLLLVSARHGDRSTLDKVLGMLSRAGIPVEIETLKG